MQCDHGGLRPGVGPRPLARPRTSVTQQPRESGSGRASRSTLARAVLHHDRPCTGHNHGPHPVGDIGGGPQTGRDGQHDGLSDGGHKVDASGHCWLPIAGDSLEQRLTTVEAQAIFTPDRDPELLYLRSKLIDLEDRSHRDNVRFLGFPESIEGANVQPFLKVTLPKLTGLSFDPPSEFQRAHRLGPKCRDGENHPRPIIACLLLHTQARQLLQAAYTHGPFRMNEQMIRMTADFSKETSERRKAFLALCPRLRQLEVKFGLFEPVRMWITKNNVSKDFCDPEDLRLFLDSLQTRPMDMTILLQPQSLCMVTMINSPQESETGTMYLRLPARGRDLERLSKNYYDRGQVLLAVAMHTQVADRDKSRFPLKPSTAPTCERRQIVRDNNTTAGSTGTLRVV
ncbi:hypothetical protein NDU88_003755 [Pleurodeles waltl]|uniref:Uncharacterized protein n=1 Tax=Pleurodeles waltl TaxID=8319 RepID=A0AAV7SGU0_PLEWA|nr:hypothetical protein NDU88_003755 [Pleurodeles waltl]